MSTDPRSASAPPSFTHTPAPHPRERRAFFASAGLGLAGVGWAGVAARIPSRPGAQSVVPGAATPLERPRPAGGPDDSRVSVLAFGADRTGATDSTLAIERAIDSALSAGRVVFFPAGTYLVDDLTLSAGTGRDGVFLEGIPGRSVLKLAGAAPRRHLLVRDLTGATISGLTFDGSDLTGANAVSITGAALIEVRGSSHVRFERCHLRHSSEDGFNWYANLTPAGGLAPVGNVIESCTVEHVADAGIYTNDTPELLIQNNIVRRCGRNGIRIQMGSPAANGSLVTGNHIHDVCFTPGQNGQSGNGVSVYRADNVIVSHNRIRNCSYSAVRSNHGSSIQILGNSCSCLGETAIWAEATTGNGLPACDDANPVLAPLVGFIVSDNVIENAARGISMTNFNNGGRLGVCSGNVMRGINNLGCTNPPVGFCEDPGNGWLNTGGTCSAIKVEADAVIANNVIEADTPMGIIAGAGPYVRDVLIQGNLIRNEGQMEHGIAVTDNGSVCGSVFVDGNMTTGLPAGNATVVAFDTCSGPAYSDVSLLAHVTLGTNAG